MFNPNKIYETFEPLEALEIDRDLFFYNHGLDYDEDEYFEDEVYNPYYKIDDIDDLKNQYFKMAYDYNFATIKKFSSQEIISESRCTEIFFLTINGIDYIITPTTMIRFAVAECSSDDNSTIMIDDINGNSYELNLIQ